MTDKREQTSDLSREEKMLRGTAWSAFGDFVSRLLGVLYVIPWFSWMGPDLADKANALFSMGYNVYGNILTWSTMGLNVAVAKQIAKYNALGEEEKGLQLTKTFLKLMLVLGMVSAAILYFGAPFFSEVSGAKGDLIPIFRSLTLAVLAYPMMSVLRGIFQGYNNIKPNSLGIMLEQLVRVAWMLAATFIIMKLGSRDYMAAVTQSTFAAFVGMMASFTVLIYYLWRDGLLTKLMTPTVNSSQSMSGIALVVETAKEAIPFILTGSAIQLFQLIDQSTFIHAMLRVTTASRDDLLVVYSYLSANPNKIVMIIISIAGSIGGVGIALLTDSFLQKDRKSTARLILNAWQMMMTFSLPALTGSILLAGPLYTVLYGQTKVLALQLFVGVLAQTLLLCVYVLFSPMLHAIFESKAAIRYFGYGLLVKLLAQFPLIYLFKSFGPVISTSLALLVSSVLMYRQLQRKTQFNQEVIVKSTFLTVLNTLIMAIVVLVVSSIVEQVLPSTSRLAAAMQIGVCGLIGILVYGYLSLKTRSIDKLLGERAHRLRQKLNIQPLS